nr:MAG TPA: hypothetical protein [Caudoviricetes sp.]
MTASKFIHDYIRIDANSGQIIESTGEEPYNLTFQFNNVSIQIPMVASKRVLENIIYDIGYVKRKKIGVDDTYNMTVEDFKYIVSQGVKYTEATINSLIPAEFEDWEGSKRTLTLEKGMIVWWCNVDSENFYHNVKERKPLYKLRVRFIANDCESISHADDKSYICDDKVLQWFLDEIKSWQTT